MTLRSAKRLYTINAFVAPLSIWLSHDLPIQPLLVVASITIFLILSDQLVRATAAATLTHVIAQKKDGPRSHFDPLLVDASTQQAVHE
jgi:hypothetical protein